MLNVKMFKIAASSLVVLAGVIASGAATHAGPAKVSKSETGQAKAAAVAAAKAQSALSGHKAQTAIKWAERAVAAAPRNADYRFLLGESYMAAGRFSSADTSYSDALALAPGHPGAGLKLALAKIAMGKGDEAIGVLEQNKASIPVADYGLALALAGDPEAAIRVLEPAARDYSATPKIRQNLALSYAIAGRWPSARAVAAQDLPAAMVDRRMTEWASFTRPTAAWDQVSSLLGVTPSEDAGQPAALALAATSPDVQVAAAVEPEAAVEAPVVTAVAEPASPDPSSEAAPVDVAQADTPDEVAVAQPIAQAEQAAPLIKSATHPAKQMVVPIKVPTAKSARAAKPLASAKPVMAYHSTESGRFVVQLGAFSSKSRASAAWSGATKRTQGLNKYAASTNRVEVRGASLYRLAVSGFTSRDDASRVCARVRSSGGQCFIRSVVNDGMIQTARRGNGTKLAARKRPAPKQPTRVASR
jgi:Flp pilus assembly protein TadD